MNHAVSRKMASLLAALMMMAIMLPAMAFAATDSSAASTNESVSDSVYTDVYNVNDDVYATVTFEDLASHWAKADIELLAGKGLVSGVTASEFQPDRAITRAEFAALIVRSIELPSVTTSTYFTDVNESAWYADTVASAVYAGIINGYEDTTFRPNDSATREELAAVIIRALDYVQISAHIPQAAQDKLLSGYIDSNEVVWAHQELAAALNANLINGVTDNQLGSSKPATRAEAAVLLKRFLKLADRL
ncbi:S-layer homology domain-containing protein [Paenibacillus caseinilyticus]|uniref:S-layer domain-containing protein n=1 Tax=Paenibacillus mucilaginosus K02 TaxID=997761 RepID=I0BBB7_9BACL|nr:S-layer homology domain-containing protein [Paenibacillus mucilaginosus]AFH59664.1 S-layer protein [Paenibacillus mucilaginosus K02]AFK65428.1 S-layer domain-containing protein [Paenibacillus mucilaginosus K02]